MIGRPVKNEDVKAGDVFQINKKYENGTGYIGALITVSEVKSWGILGYIHHVETGEESSLIYLRIGYEFLEYIGRAVLKPANEE